MLCDDCKNKEACRFYIASFKDVNHPLNDPYYRDAFYCDKHCTVEKPITNADRIRAMTDAELAYWMTHLHEDGHCLNERCQIFQDKTCEECVIDWLKQPVEGEHG